MPPAPFVFDIRPGAAEQTAQTSRRPGLERDESPSDPQHAPALGEHSFPQLGRSRREQTTDTVEDDHIVRAVGKRQRVKRADMHVGERTGFGDRGTCSTCCCFVADDDGRQPGEPCFGGDGGHDIRAVNADLQRAFAEPCTAHRDRQRLDANARLPQKPAHFPMI